MAARDIILAGQQSATTTPGVLDSLSTPARIAYSIRRLRGAYAGAAFNVRRSSDSATQDIGFTSTGDLNTTALLSFVGSGTGYITKWYDQSGNGINVAQTTTTLQPVIVSAGVIYTINTLPSIYFSGTTYLLGTALLASTAGWTASAVAQPTSYTNSNPQSVVDQDNYNTGPRVAQFLRFVNNTVQGIAFNTFATPYGTVSPANSPIVLTSVLTPTTITVYGNGTAGTAAAFSGTIEATSANFSIGRGQLVTTPQYLTGYISEGIVFSAPLSSTDVATLTQNQITYY